MSSNMRVFYLYIVSLISLIIFAGGIVATVYNSTRYIFPNSYSFYLNDVKTQAIDELETYDIDGQDYKEIERQNYKRETIKDAIVSVLVIVIGYSLYNYHWKLIEKERELLNN